MNSKVTIIDYGLGNLHSLWKAFNYLGIKTNVDVDGTTIKNSDRIVIPGVGAFGEGMKGLKKRNQIEPILEFALSEKPILGICLGSQLLLSESSEFGYSKGLDLIPGKVTRLSDESNLVPHVGWNKIIINKKSPSINNNLVRSINENTWAYFVHSYQCRPLEDNHVIAYCNYGDSVVTASVCKQNIIGFQFHPEKSSYDGLKMLNQFIGI